MALTDNCVAYWKLDESSAGSSQVNRVDEVSGHTLTDINTTASGTGKIGNGADFEEGNNEALNMADHADLSFGNEDFSLAVWVNMESDSDDNYVVSKWDFGANDREWSILYDFSDDRFCFDISSNGTAYQREKADNLGAPSTSTWYFIVAWHDADANTMNIQVNNGTVDSASYSSGCNDNISKVGVGCCHNSGNPASTMDGIVDEFGVWSRVLSESERTQLYNGGNGLTYPFITFTPRTAIIF